MAQQLTQEYKLIPAIKKDISLTNLENMNEHEVARYKVYMAIAENLPHCNSWELLVDRLHKQGINTQFKYKGQTQEIQGVSFKTGKYSFKGSQVDRKFSFAGLQKALAQGIKNDIEQTLEQKERAIQPQNARQIFQKIHASKRSSQIPDQDVTAKEKAGELLKGMNTVFEDLLTTKSTEENLPYELTQEGYLRKQRKQAHKHKR
jgi:hypothetical protein